MKVLMLSWEYPPRIIGGIARVVHDLTEELSKENIEIHLVTCGNNDIPCYEKNGNIYIYRVEPYAIQNYNFIQWVYQLNLSMIAQVVKIVSEKGEFDIIHAHDWITAFCAVTIKNILNIPLVSTIHATEFGRNNGLHNDFQRYISNVEWWLTYETWKVICNSKYMENQLIGFFQLPKDKISIIPNGVRIEDFRTHVAENQFKLKYSAPNEKIVFFVGRLVQEKGVQILIHAIPQVLQEYKDVKFVIAGTGPNSEQLKKQAMDLDVYNKIFFSGFIDDETRNKLFSIAEIAVFPSLYEPFGIVALEGMAAGVPIIVSDTGGLREIVNHGKNGMKFSSGSSQELASQIIMLLKEPELAKRIAHNGAKHVMETYNWNIISRQTLEVYRGILQQKRKVINN